MKLEDQVTSLELSKKLKELGFKQESLFYYSKPYDTHDYCVFREIQKGSKYPPISAYTVAELGEMLPEEIKRYDSEFCLGISIGLDKRWFIDYRTANDGQLNAFEEDNLVNAMARMLIYLKENKLI